MTRRGWTAMIRLRVLGIFAAFALAFGAAFGAGCAGPSELEAALRARPTADSYAALGEYFGDQEQHECAAQAWVAALRLEPRSAKFAYLLGLNLYAGGHAEEAAAALRKSVGLNPRSLQGHLLLATVLDQLGRGKAAAGEWRAALMIDPSSTLALDGVAKALLAAKDFAGAIQLLEDAPPDESLALDLGIAYDRAGNLNQAAAELAKAGEAFPASTKLANALALVYLRQMRHRDAAALMEKQYALHPDDLETQVDYLRVLVISEDREKAFPLGKIVLARLPHDFTALYLNGQLERETGDYAAAKAHLEEAVRLDPQHANCRYNLGVALARLNEPAAAKAEFERAIALGWSGPEIHYELAGAARALGDGETAKAQMLAYQRETRAKEARSEAANKLGQGDEAMRGGDLAGAEAQYRLATEADAEFAPAWVGLAAALAKEGKLAEAKEAVGQALRVEPGDARAVGLAQSLGLKAARSGGDPANGRP